VIGEGVKLLGKKARRPDQALAIEDKKASTDDEDVAG
jgi:hypothetical protein